ncbi:hypothetical protein JB92DRAFT_2136027 [Gautieria morchelliformis]|nr:hypothetical protein JB92DRAFT_2136027 [Gautieria morchelliformis]
MLPDFLMVFTNAFATLMSAVTITQRTHPKKFDDQAVAHRLGATCKNARNRTNELVKRFHLLKKFVSFVLPQRLTGIYGGIPAVRTRPSL